MKSKIIKKEPEQAKVEYPCLMKHTNGNVFLMKDKIDGFMVFNKNLEDDGSDWPLGNSSEGWGDIDDFAPFTGTIELSNE